MGEEEGELVGTGGFRVAGARALEVLRSTQLSLNFWRPLLWFRVAAALEAAQVEVTAGQSSLTFSFDGRPLPKTLVTDPLSPFEGGDAPPEARWLAYALVHSLAKGVTVTLTSGRGERRRAQRFDHQGHGAPARPDPGQGTVVLVDWPAVAGYQPSTGPWTWFAAEERNAFPMLGGADAVPYRLKTPDGEVLPWEKRKEREAAVFRDGARRIRVELGGGRRLGLHQFGVRAAGGTLDDMALPLSLDVDDPALTLDASLNAVVEDTAYHSCVAAGRNAAFRHGLARLERHAKAMRRCAKLLLARPELRRHWRAALAAPERIHRRLPWMARALSALKGRSVPSGDALRVARAAEFTAFLRDAASSRLRGRAFDERLPLGLTLWDVPLLFSATGRPLSLADLDLDERRCSVWDKADPAPAGLGSMMVWALSPADAAFAKAFPRRPARLG
jgi:hypothetical protein